MITLVKTGLKLLLRTKAFWFFLILTPVLSTVVLKSRFDSSAAYMNREDGKIIDLENDEDKVAYNGGRGEYLVKVYDASKSKLSEELLQNLAKSGMYMICRVDLSDKGNIFTEDYMDYHIKRDGFEDRMGAAIYIYPDFGRDMTVENLTDELKICVLSDDKRTELLESDIEFMISEAAVNGEEFIHSINEVYNNKKVVTISGSVENSLTAKQVNQRTQIGYAFAFMTLGFVFCGIFVAHTAIREEKNGVLTRITLTKTSTIKYFVSKLITAVIISLMSTGVMGVCSLLMDENDIGMSRFKYLAMIFMLGLIFSSISMLLGIIIGDIMSANVAAFSVWCMSALLGGLFFPLDDSSNLIKVLGSVMPQKWFLKGAEMILTGDNSVCSMLICITVAYLAVVISMGGLGLKLRRASEWGDS